MQYQMQYRPAGDRLQSTIVTPREVYAFQLGMPRVPTIGGVKQTSAAETLVNVIHRAGEL